MLYSICGTLIHKEPRLAVVECGGVGFACHVTLQTAAQLPSVGNQTKLFTALNVREDAMELFGFAALSELTCFRQLTSVSGVGPKVAMAILSELSPERVAVAVSCGDYKALTKASGVGPKLAQRIALELRDKFKDVPTAENAAVMVDSGVSSVSGNAAQAVGALTVLGFSATEASAAIGKLDSAQPVEVLVRQALKLLSGNR